MKRINRELISSKPFFLLYSCCFPVDGAIRSLICDTQRNSFIFIPNILFDIIEQCKSYSVLDVINQYGQDNEKEIFEYLEFLLENDYGFLTDQPGRFPPIAMHLDEYSIINNAIVDLTSSSTYNYERLFNKLDELYCEAIQIRIFDAPSFDFVESVVAKLEGTGFTTVELVISDPRNLSNKDLRAILKKNSRICHLVVCSCDKESHEQFNGRQLTKLIQKISSSNDCGCISPAMFSTDLRHYIEATRHNTCLNKKISTDIHGKVKNCPSMSHDYGDFDTLDLLEVINQEKFRQLWSIKKDSIEVCKDCEFRYICSDCRAYTADKNNPLSKPEKCSYDPYTAKWN